MGEEDDTEWENERVMSGAGIGDGETWWRGFSSCVRGAGDGIPCGGEGGRESFGIVVGAGREERRISEGGGVALSC